MPFVYNPQSGLPEDLQREIWAAENPDESGQVAPSGTSAPAAQPGAVGGDTVQTRDGPLSITELRNRLTQAHYNGPWDPASMVAAYNRAPGGSGGGTGGGRTGGGGFGLDAQIRAQQDMLDAIATGNREKFEEAKRQFEASLRQSYTEMFGYDTGGAQAGPPNLDLAKQLKANYDAMKAHKGGVLASNDPDLLASEMAITGLSAAQLADIKQQGKQYFASTGKVIPDEALAGLIAKQYPAGRFPTEKAREFGQELGEKQREFDTSTFSDFARSLLSASTQMRGPRDYAAYQKMLSGGKDILGQLAGSDVQPGFGFSGNPEPARITDVLDALGISQWRPRQAAPAGP